MLIEIRQKKISIGDKYRIFINGQEVYKAAARIFRLFPYIEVMPPGGSPQFAVKMGLGIFRPQATFQVGGTEYHLTTLSWFRRRFLIEAGMQRFEIVGHRGRKVSIFQNDRQIAWFESDAITFLEGDVYRMQANNNAPVDWLITIVLFWDSWYNRKDKGVVNIKFGSIFESQPFDRNWQPLG